ncbi:hypothetical protein KEM48_014639 [Puccinia striiformis f. sp. tritici PST-130]|uniref:SAM-dependent MTase RsmB/NOP-type domain-containing protein n=2 Tax=Puccinia striiformis f. sp. tritici PST-78 TaxID=1165861 RepID=A0A0L0V6K1_9BASI|nr:hypothetical protein KEM48_014639 [Puccinia striiformis f. sp. tritici PST-130]KNE94898.1 hypothetical protein PSTG_11798 [Puccinia striiformis f. sp. tritici PST-78]
MIPPLLLDVQLHHYVLDACAATGSKTAQLVESLHHLNPGLILEGLMIVNDSDYKHSHLLVHQSLCRLPSPSTVITNHDASRFPTLSISRISSTTVGIPVNSSSVWTTNTSSSRVGDSWASCASTLEGLVEAIYGVKDPGEKHRGREGAGSSYRLGEVTVQGNTAEGKKTEG